MHLHVDSDAAYLCIPIERSCIAGYFRMLNATHSDSNQENGAILVECKDLRWVVSSAAEAEIHGVFHNSTIALNLKNIFKHMVIHNQ